MILSGQLLVEFLVGLGFLLEGLVFEGAGVEGVELGLGLSDGFLEHGLAVLGLAVLDFDAADDAGADGGELGLDLGDLGGGLAVFGVVGTVVGLDVAEMLVGVFELLGEALEGFALGGDLGGFDLAGADGVVGGLLADALGLGGGVVGIELEEAGGEDAVFSSGLMTFSSRSNLARASAELSILALSS